MLHIRTSGGTGMQKSGFRVPEVQWRNGLEAIFSFLWIPETRVLGTHSTTNTHIDATTIVGQASHSI